MSRGVSSYWIRSGEDAKINIPLCFVYKYIDLLSFCQVRFSLVIYIATSRNLYDHSHV